MYKENNLWVTISKSIFAGLFPSNLKQQGENLGNNVYEGQILISEKFES